MTHEFGGNDKNNENTNGLTCGFFGYPRNNSSFVWYHHHHHHEHHFKFACVELAKQCRCKIIITKMVEKKGLVIK